MKTAEDAEDAKGFQNFNFPAEAPKSFWAIQKLCVLGVLCGSNWP